jgi:excisionase family DNA binding protein
MSKTEPLATIRQAAKRLNLSTHTLRHWKATGRIGYVRLGRAIRIPESEIARVIREGTVQPEREERTSVTAG